LIARSDNQVSSRTSVNTMMRARSGVMAALP
jgi:hypothetical protein